MAEGFKFELGAEVFFLHENKVVSSKVYARRRVDAKPAFRAGYDEKEACSAFGDFGSTGTITKVEYSVIAKKDTHYVAQEEELFPSKQSLLSSL